MRAIVYSANLAEDLVVHDASDVQVLLLRHLNPVGTSDEGLLFPRKCIDPISGLYLGSREKPPISRRLLCRIPISALIQRLAPPMPHVSLTVSKSV